MAHHARVLIGDVVDLVRVLDDVEEVGGHLVGVRVRDGVGVRVGVGVRFRVGVRVRVGVGVKARVRGCGVRARVSGC